MGGLLVKGGTVVTGEGTTQADVYAEGGVIRAIGADLGAFVRAARTVDAREQLVLPGAVDPHVHFDLPFGESVSCDGWEDGTIAALVGGTTTVFDFVTGRKGQGLLEALEPWMARPEGLAACDYAFHQCIVDWSPAIEREVAELVRRGIPSFKTFTAYKGALMLEDEPLFQAMRAVARAGGIMAIHAVNGGVLAALAEGFAARGRLGTDVHHLCQPPEAEAEATHRAIRLAGLAGVPLYVVHTTCEEALGEIQAARARGREVYCETCPHYLVLDDDVYGLPDFEGAKYVLSPPLRRPGDQDALWSGIRQGGVQSVGTDHAPFRFADQKALGRGDFRRIPNGLAGVEERLSLLYTYGVAEERISLGQLVEVCCTRPARIFGLGGRKGVLAVGADADICVYDPRWEGTFSAASQRSRCDYSCYEGWRRVGRPSHVFVRGVPVVQGGEFCGEPGFGRFLPRAPRGA